MKPTVRILIGALLLAAAGLVADPTLGQSRNEFRALLQRVVSLEKELQSLRRSGGSLSPTTVVAPRGANIEALVERQESMGAELKDQQARITDTVERVRFEVTKLSRRMDKLVRDVDQRLSELEANVIALQQEVPAEGGGAAGRSVVESAQGEEAAPVASGAPASAPVAATTNVLPKGTPIEQYGHVQNLLKQLKFSEAELALKEFLDKHPKNDLAENARYWLGETFYVRKDYETAARIFLEGYQAKKQGRKAPDNLLKLGISLRRLGQKEDACATLSELIRGYKLAAKNLLDRARSEIDEIGCT